MKFGVKCVCEPWQKVDYWMPPPSLGLPRFESEEYEHAVVYLLAVEQSNPGCSFEIQEIKENEQ